MAEIFGVVAGVVGIASAFTACIDCFDHVQSGRHLDRDFQIESLKLECARYRLARWGAATNVYFDPPFHGICHDQETISLADSVLRQILQLFETTATISQRYQDANRAVAVTNLIEESESQERAGKLLSKMKKITLRRRRKGPGLAKRATWALYHREQFEHLLKGIVGLLDQLEALVVAPEAEAALLQDDVKELASEGMTEMEDVLCLEAAASVADKQLVATVKEEGLFGHRYENVAACEQARVLNGDSVASDWTEKHALGSNQYRNIIVSGQARVQSGNRYGGKDFFDD